VSDDTDETVAALGRIEATLDDVEAALARLHEGTYAVCASCGRAIDDERLQADPATRSCSACAPAGVAGATLVREPTEGRLEGRSLAGTEGD